MTRLRFGYGEAGANRREYKSAESGGAAREAVRSFATAEIRQLGERPSFNSRAENLRKSQRKVSTRFRWF